MLNAVMGALVISLGALTSVNAVRIEGERDGKLRGVDFPMKRVACDALAGARELEDDR
jgi:hypothetical protein